LDKFFNIKQQIITTDKGDVGLPIFYYDFSSIVFSYLADKTEAEILLKGSGLKPALVLGNKVMVIIVFFEYRDTSIGSYNEVALTTLSYPEDNPKPFCPLINFIKKGQNWNIGAYIHNLPVTTEIANAAGRKIWTYPKFVTPIPFKLKQPEFSGSVKDPDSGDDIFSIKGNTGKLGLGSVFNSFDLVIYSNHKNELIKTIVDTRGKAWYGLNGNFELKTGSSKHEMGDNI